MMDLLNVISGFSEIYTQTIKMLIDIKLLDREDIDYVSKGLGIPESKVIETGCGSTQVAIKYLLNIGYDINLPPEVFISNEIEQDKIYLIDLIGIDKNKKTTRLGHVFVLFRSMDDYYIADSYINQHKFRITKIDLEEFIQNLYLLNKSFDIEIWEKMFNVKVRDDELNTAIIVPEITYTTYNLKENSFERLKRVHGLISNNI